MKKLVLITLFALASVIVSADIKVSDVEVFSGYPWKEVVIGYTITGTDAYANFIRLTATDKSANRSYTTTNLTGAVISEGRHIMRWNAASECAQFSSTNVVFDVSVMSYGGVQLWENGPYWAECNIGAERSEEYGYYFSWCDTVGCVYERDAMDSNFDRCSIFNRVDGSCAGCSFDHGPVWSMGIEVLKSKGYIDEAGNLAVKYDAASLYLGVPWRMPTEVEWEELFQKCAIIDTTRNGVRGILVRGKDVYASNSIFLPAAGHAYVWRTLSLEDVGTYGCYWSATIDSSDPRRAMCARFRPGSVVDCSVFDIDRFRAKSVRPVRGANKE